MGIRDPREKYKESKKVTRLIDESTGRVTRNTHTDHWDGHRDAHAFVETHTVEFGATKQGKGD